jgi:hypothetical protein
MKRIILFCSILALAVSASAAEAGESELTGVLSWRKAWTGYLLKLDGGGELFLELDSVSLRKAANDIVWGEKDKETRIWVLGTIKSKLYRQPPPDYKGSFSTHTQWHIFMTVKDFKRITEPFERPGDETPAEPRTP